MVKQIKYKGKLWDRSDYYAEIGRISGKLNKGRPRPDLKKGGKNYENIVAGIRRRYGPITLADRLRDHVVINKGTDCHEWQAAKSLTNYGYFTIRGPNGKKNYYVHRAVYKHNYGEIPDGKIIMHKCDNPCCCNINHLLMGTRKDNQSDMVRKNRHPAHMKKGWINTKITEDQFNEFINPDISVLSLSKKYKISRDTITEIRKTKDRKRLKCQD